MESQADRLGLRDQVSFIGFTDRLAEWMVAADCLVMLSRAEGLATVLLHAAATATPFVSTDVDGPAELIRLGANGAIVPIGDWRAAAAATGDVLSRLRSSPLELADWNPDVVRERYRTIFDRLRQRAARR
jgi:glycosyltransferase involved in cell wall biosynthesis